MYIKFRTQFSKLTNIISNYINLKPNSGQELLFQKVKCYDIKSETPNNAHYKKNPTVLYTIEKDNPKMLKLSENQKHLLNNYMNKCLHDYILGEIYIDEDTIKIFRKVQSGIENNENIQKYYIDYVIRDMNNSFSKMGYEQENIYV
jgi:hypothetical protein